MIDERSNFNNGLRPGKPYVGKVVDNNDPKGWCRIRVRIDNEFFKDIPDDHLPWAIVSCAHPGGASALHGMVDIPVNGSKVLVEFQDGSPMHPVWKGYFVDEETKLPEAAVNYPDRRVILWPSGSLMVLDDKTNEVFVRNQGDLHFYVTGDAYVKVDGNLVQKIEGNRTTFVGGNDMTVVAGDYGVYSANMKLKASGNQALAARSSQALYGGSGVTVDSGGIVHLDSGTGDQTGAAPSEPTFPEWQGVRGQTP